MAIARNLQRSFIIGPQPYVPASVLLEAHLGVSSRRLLNNSSGGGGIASGPGGSDDGPPDSDSLAVILDPEMGKPPPR